MGPNHATPKPPVLTPATAEEDLFATLPKGADARAALCAPPVGRDVVAANLCGATPPEIHGLRDLQKVLGFDFMDSTDLGSNGGADGNPVYAITGHSSSLVVQSVSAINPRAIVCKDFGAIKWTGASPPANPNFFACMGFTRGENFVEVATTDAGTGALNFYLIEFETACSQSHTCQPADLLTPTVESNWVAYNAYEDDPYFKDTILDCRQCHQPNAAAQPMLRMQETTSPYTHFFSAATPGGRALLTDFWNAHGTQEDYGPIPAARIKGASGNDLAVFLQREGFLAKQPNAFNSALIEQQVDAANAGQPENNTVPGQSAAWNTLFAYFQGGLDIPPPYHDVKVTDPNKLATFSSLYREVQTGVRSDVELPDIRAIFPDSQSTLAQMGLAAVPGQSPQALLANACAQCHNANLDQDLSRARFNVNKLLNGTLSSGEKQVAIDRLQLDASDLHIMPPKRFRSLQPAEIQQLVSFLQ